MEGKKIFSSQFSLSYSFVFILFPGQKGLEEMQFTVFYNTHEMCSGVIL